MKHIFIVFFLVFYPTTCFKTAKKDLPEKKKGCQKIKCPPVDEPVCARVTTVNNNKSLHIIMVNQCEMEYMKCHQGIQGNVVDMSNCGHEEYQSINKLIKNKGRKRIKRHIHSEIRKLDTKLKHKKIARNNGTHIIMSMDASGDTEVTPDNIEQSAISPLEDAANGFLDTSESNEVIVTATPDLDIDDETVTPELDDISQEMATDENQNQEAGESAETPVTDNDLPETVNDLPPTEHDLPKPEPTKPLSEDAPDAHSNGALSDKLESNLKFSDKTIFDNVHVKANDYDQYQGDCPTSCPSRDVMVCAKCQHGIYKTFMSVCHMRMFSCWFLEEKLELVSRYPCVMSAPYLSANPDTRPKETISLPGDEDRILKFIYCREQGDPSYMEDRNKLSLPQTSNVYPNCDLNKDMKRKLRNKAMGRQSNSFSTY